MLVSEITQITARDLRDLGLHI